MLWIIRRRWNNFCKQESLLTTDTKELKHIIYATNLTVKHGMNRRLLILGIGRPSIILNAPYKRHLLDWLVIGLLPS